ncbi:MAG: cysteine desulfurase IscS [Gemmatales bacterium]|nr:MAG: cysteine desulfurase IscS [Gemmatales bacterium]
MIGYGFAFEKQEDSPGIRKTMIYLDNNATTPMLPEVEDAMLRCQRDAFGNPASAHTIGRKARQKFEEAREKIADLLGAAADEVVFTSGATEANNLALFGLSASASSHLLASPIEHPSVAEPLKQLQHQGHAVDYLTVDSQGILDSASFRDKLRPDTQLVTAMLVNHEIGAIQPVQQLTAQCPASVSFHCDAVQAVGKLPVHFQRLGVTTLSLSAHKFHGPKGIGALLVRRGTRLKPCLFGGHQQQSRRPGTEPVPLAVGMATALEIACANLDDRLDHVRRLRHSFLTSLAPVGPIVHGASEDCRQSPYTANVSFPGCLAESLLMNLDLIGVACSTGSACSSGSLLPSPVLKAMGVEGDILRSAMRFSFSHLLTEREVIEAGRRIVEVVTRLRSMEEKVG